MHVCLFMRGEALKIKRKYPKIALSVPPELLKRQIVSTAWCHNTLTGDRRRSNKRLKNNAMQTNTNFERVVIAVLAKQMKTSLSN